MAAPSQPVPVSLIGSPRSRRSAQEGSLPVPGEQYLPVDPTATATVQQPGSSHNTRSGRRSSSKFSQLAKRAMGKSSIDGPEHHAEESLISSPARGPSPPVMSSAESSSDAYEGTTAVGHDNLIFAQTMGSPVYVAPKPTNDYAKMESPRASIASFNSYINRVKQFFHEFNDLPWVAERVTIDYIPGASKDRRRVRVNQLHRPSSWYGNTPHSRRPSLFSDSTESPGAQPPQVQLPSQDQFPTLQSLNRSHSAQQWAQQEPPRSPTPQQDVFWEITDTSYPSNVPFATVVPANWTLHQVVPPEPFQPTIATQQAHLEPHPPSEAQPAANLPTTPMHPSTSTWLHSGIPKDGSQRFVPIGETFPTGYVPYENVASIEAQGEGFHPQSQDPVPQQSGSASMATGAEQAGKDGLGAGAPQTARGLDAPFVTSFGRAGGYDPNTQSPVAAPTPRVASGSAAQGGGPANARASPRVTVVSPTSSGRPPSVAPSRASRTSQRSHGLTPSVRQVQGEIRPPSAAPSRASRTPSMSQTPNRPLSAAISHAH